MTMEPEHSHDDDLPPLSTTFISSLCVVCQKPPENDHTFLQVQLDVRLWGSYPAPAFSSCKECQPRAQSILYNAACAEGFLELPVALQQKHITVPRTHGPPSPDWFPVGFIWHSSCRAWCLKTASSQTWIGTPKYKDIPVQSFLANNPPFPSLFLSQIPGACPGALAGVTNFFFTPE